VFGCADRLVRVSPSACAYDWFVPGMGRAREPADTVSVVFRMTRFRERHSPVGLGDRCSGPVYPEHGDPVHPSGVGFLSKLPRDDGFSYALPLLGRLLRLERENFAPIHRPTCMLESRYEWRRLRNG
jgi:hypothetical protein